MDSSQPGLRADAKKIGIQIITAVLWLTTVGLGLLAVLSFQDAMYVQTNIFVLRSIENQTMGITTGSGLERVVQYAILFVGIPLWIGIAIFGMEFHFKPKNIGRRKSFRILAWTIGIEVAIIIISLLLRNG
jgi:hypothetical protein